ncbi:hypothetical protein [Curtobacterium sp. MCBD17_040]|uniref:hypothetical protein n=1 Tax=Curtobacterium sp. MCBD17_040 TaxID=2175674 RepID=UPI0011B515D1|nr:hypothetical protein [Curtobacterium sp. MCBD17_040]WIB65479.1 hypothetical protein DEI94_19085 [Curtobacterium sp. MCBD17_040]
MTILLNAGFPIGVAVVHRHPTTPGGIDFGPAPRVVSGVGERTTDGVTTPTVTVGSGATELTVPAADVDYAPHTQVRDPLGREGVVVREVEPAPEGVHTRVAFGGSREWVPTDLLTAVDVRAPETVWASRHPDGTTVWGDEATASADARAGAGRKLILLTGTAAVIEQTPAAGKFALIDLEQLRSAAERGPEAVAAVIAAAENRPDFLTEVEESLHTPAGTWGLIDEYRRKQRPSA